MTRRSITKAKVASEPSSYSLSAQNISHFVRAAKTGNWREAFATKHLASYHMLERRKVAQAKLLLIASAEWRRDVQPPAVNAIFSTNRADHSFKAPLLDWGFGLTEPMATRSLAKLLSVGSPELRAERIRAFLQAIRLPAGRVTLTALKQCQVTAETDRIDMKFVWKDDFGNDAVVIIEAKFGHRITLGQLSGYRNIIRRTHGVVPVMSVLLTLDDRVCADLHGQQRTQWKQVNWRDFWLRFERLRPAECNPSLQMFLNTLWHRIGCLTQENRHGLL